MASTSGAVYGNYPVYALAVFQDAQEIVRNVYLTSFVGANAETLFRLKIRAVINCSSNLPHINVPGVAYYRAPMEDSLVEMISSYFEPISNIIDQFVMKGHAVLIHCQAGVSRSATCLLAYMISRHNYSLREAIDVMKRRRYLIKPNPFFMEQLVSYEEICRRPEKKYVLRQKFHHLPLPQPRPLSTGAKQLIQKRTKKIKYDKKIVDL